MDYNPNEGAGREQSQKQHPYGGQEPDRYSRIRSVGSLWILSDAHIGNMLHASTG